jgi:8-oxo-dGTP pyrophosphatase MutT (NUDIX family)
MEYFDLYDEHMNKLDKTMLRGGSNNEGEYHLVVHIWIRNKKGQYLIQQRNKQEDVVPYQWAITGGAVLAGETSIEGAIRETKEEIGIDVLPEELQRIKRYFIKHQQSNYITDLYLVQKDIDLNHCVLDKKEVRAVDYKTMSDIRQMIKEDTFWNYEHMMERRGYLTLLEKS